MTYLAGHSGQHERSHIQRSALKQLPNSPGNTALVTFIHQQAGMPSAPAHQLP